MVWHLSITWTNVDEDAWHHHWATLGQNQHNCEIDDEINFNWLSTGGCNSNSQSVISEHMLRTKLMST